MDKKYEEALERAKQGLPIDEVFPELKESEDERIRKILVGMVNNQTGEWKDKDKILAYLEKQEEHKPLSTEETELNSIAFLEQLGYTCVPPGTQQKHIEDVIENITKNKEAATNFLKSAGIMNDNGELAEMYRSEQKPAASWTIQDARPGDILNSVRVQATIIFKGFNPDGKHIDAYCALQNGIFIAQECLWDRDFEPATQVWKYAIFDAMARKGYLWDTKNKRLNKTEQQPAEWSEGIKKTLDEISDYLKYRGMEDEADFIRDLRPQPSWKPSKQQMEALKNAIPGMYQMDSEPPINHLRQLYNDLKKL